MTGPAGLTRKKITVYEKQEMKTQVKKIFTTPEKNLIKIKPSPSHPKLFNTDQLEN
jgi:hypothetical protein